MTSLSSPMLGLGSSALCVFIWLRYLSQIPRERVPESPRLEVLGLAAASTTALVALAWSIASGQNPLVNAILAVASLSLTVFFVYLLKQRNLPAAALVVAVGDSLPEFSAMSSEGKAVRSESWLGRPVLLKFFRGHW